MSIDATDHTHQRVMADDKEMSPSAMIKFYAGVGAAAAARVQNIRRILDTAPDELREKIKRKLAREILNDNGFPFTKEDQEEIFDALFNPKMPIIPTHYRAFFAYLHIASIIAANEDGLPTDPQSTTDTFWAARWAACGLPVFSLTHGLAAALLLTEPPPFDPSTFELPFPAFVVTLPQGYIPFLNGDANDKRAWGETLFVHRFDGKVDNKTRDLLHVDVRSRERNLWHRKPVEEVLSVKREQSVFDAKGFELVEDDYRTIEVALRLVRNLVAWMDANGRGELQGRKFSKAELRNGYRHDRDHSPIPTNWLLGKEVKIAPELRRIAAEVALGEKHGGPGWKLRMRHCVRGHWKMQVCGEGRADRKQIHVAAYWKGPEGAAAWAHVYTDGEKR